MKLSVLNRKLHYWGAIICALPVMIILCSGMLLMLKKQLDWIQPPAKTGSGHIPSISFNTILEQARSVARADISSWGDIKKVDVRPSKGIMKILAKNGMEIQIDSKEGTILQVAQRRSDLIESIHDGSFFHEYAKLGLFLPAALVLLMLSITGLYLFILPLVVKRRRSRAMAAAYLCKQKKEETI